MECLGQPQIAAGLRRALDGYYRRLQCVASVAIVGELILALDAFHDIAIQGEALPEFRATCQAHPLHHIALQDPYTARAFNKPRGYAGDAVMLDYIYRPRAQHTTDLGAAVHLITTREGAAKTIIWRRENLGAEIARTINFSRNARILSVASGHLRELDIVRAAETRRDFEIVAFDQDDKSLQEAVNSNPDINISPINRSISHLFKAHDGSKYDLIYSAGLFDYLTTNTASGLLTRLTEMLTPNGRLLVGNYAPENYGRGYMEGMMDWSLIYRNEAELEMLLESNKERRAYRDAPGNVVYLEISSHWN